MKRIDTPQISPNKSLTTTFNDMFGKYLTPINETYTDELRDEAEQDIQDDIIDELMDEIVSAQLIQPVDRTFEVDLDLDSLREWLQLYYRLEKK